MQLLNVSFELPLKEPVLVFSLVLFVILLAPLLAKKLRLPGIIGLILAGVLIGPNGFNLLLRNSSIVLFGTVGLLYIMFLAGLEIDLNDFKKNKNRSIVFGMLTFFVPISIGTVICYYLLEYSLISSILLSSMFSSHTLVAYPIISRLGLIRKEAVTITIGGTIITDTAVLLVLAIITATAQGEVGIGYWIQLAVSLTIFAFIILWVIPKISKWFFRNIESEGVSQYIFVLAVVFLSAFLAELAGVEAIIGAFLGGLALNRQIPHTSPLMNRIEFVGNAIFIPFFLISVGMLVDIKVLFNGTRALFVAGTVIIVAFCGKWLAAFLTQKIFKYSVLERNLIFGLSSAHAAATLAVVLVGYNLKLLDENVLNATILLILVTCLVSSLVAENQGRKLAIAESKKAINISDVPNRILVPISNPATIEQLIDFAILIKERHSDEPIYPLAVVKDADDTQEQLMASKKMLEKAILHASATEHSVQLVSRIDVNIASGILRAIRELMITEVVIGWNGKVSTREMIFGSVLDNLLLESRQMIMVCKILHPLNTMSRVVVVVPPNAELEKGFFGWVHNLKMIASQIGADVHFLAGSASTDALKNIISQTKPSVKASYESFEHWDQFAELATRITTHDLFMVISARQTSLSYHSFLDRIPKLLARHFGPISFVITYPQQQNVSSNGLLMEGSGDGEMIAVTPT